MMRMVAPLGSLSPLHASGAGKALLAALDQEERAELVTQLNFDVITHKTLRSRASLSKEIERIIAEGWSYDPEEYVDGMHCIAALVFRELGALISALSVCCPFGSSVRVTETSLCWHGVTPKNWSSHA